MCTMEKLVLSFMNVHVHAVPIEITCTCISYLNVTIICGINIFPKLC